MATTDDALILGGAVVGGLILARAARGSDGQNGGGGDTQPTCEQQVAAAQDYASNASGCSDGQFVMACPHAELSYTATSTCERNWLQNKGWEVTSTPGDDPPNDDNPPDPDPVEYTFQILSDSPTPVDYTLHVGPRPTALGASAVGERHRAETSNTVDPQYASETIQQLSDGTWQIDGSTGSSDGTVYGDSFAWTTIDHQMYGILGWQASQGSDAYSVEVNGTTINPNELPVLSI